MVVQNNPMALNANRQATLNNAKLQTALMQLSSGYRINSAADDAAGLALSERMRAQHTGIERAIMNAQDGSSLVGVAEGALSEVHSMLNRLTDLAVQASNGTLQDSQRQSLDREASEILSEIDRISQATNFNGINLLDNSLSNAGSSVAVQGVQVDEAPAVAGSYTTSEFQDMSALAAGDEVSFTLGLNNGSANVMSFTVSEDLSSMTAQDGTVYQLNGTVNGDTVDVQGEVMASAVADQLSGMSAADSFAISNTGATIDFAAREAGTESPQIAGLSSMVNGAQLSTVAMNQNVVPADTQAVINSDSFQLFDGTNESSATFSVNGSSFVLVNEADYAQTISNLENSDVTAIQVSGTSGDTLTAEDLDAIAGNINHRTGMAFTTSAEGIEIRTPYGEGGLDIQVGDTADSYNSLNIQVGDMGANGLGIGSISLASQEEAASALQRITAAIETVSSTRGELGATQNRLESTIQNLQTTSENIVAAESRVRDTDMAKTILELTRRNVLSQASQAMQAQANLQTQQVLQLLK